MNFKKIVSNTSWLITDKIVLMAANLLVTVFLARSLGPELYGVFSYILAIVAISAPISALGLNAIVTREIVNEPAWLNKIISTTLFLRLCAAVLVGVFFVTLILVSNLFTDETQSITLAVLAIGNIFTSFQVLDFWFQAKVLAKNVTKMKFLITIFSALLKITVAIFYQDIFYIAVIYALEIVIIAIGFIYIYSSSAKSSVFNFKNVDFVYAKKLIKQSSWLILSGIASIIYLKIDQLMLNSMIGPESVGTYAVASRLSEVWYFFANALVITLFPTLLKLKNDSVNYRVKLQSICDALFISALFLAIFVTIFGGFFIDILFGAPYEQSTTILQWHIWASLFVFMRALASKWLIAEGLLKFSLLTHGIGAAINVTANYFLIPIYQGEGAAIATVLSYFSASFLAFFISKSTRVIAIIMLRSILLPFTLARRYWYLISEK
ncbi:flippase [Pseudoalteromonas carrageenovora]|uniref:flippase n=1 Tax=Pseudoalteromonas carrageenovora TaxID=227 RepID=UPI0026E18352|nr:flippase [Pseudoalteromonas carrageenovora]MDO6548923.1 flippase [Pseudoalteromonas carrageenovora]MDO6833428.1 flippase [Pseudoalteromonas carrageenovora]